MGEIMYTQKQGSKNVYTPVRGSIKIIIPGRPVPKARPRLGKGGNVYTPEKTKQYEELVAWKTKEVIKEPLTGNVAVYIKVYVKGDVFPDLDNIAKSILDGMNKVAYYDDKQVACLVVQRIKSREEKVEVELEEVEADAAAGN